MTNTEPVMNNNWGYLLNVDRIIMTTNGAMISGDLEEYYNCLQSWYTEVYPRIMGNKKISKNLIEELISKRKQAMQTRIFDDMQNFHLLLNQATHKAGLRIANSSSMPGFMQTR